jgi:hypothetical protein
MNRLPLTNRKRLFRYVKFPFSPSTLTISIIILVNFFHFCTSHIKTVSVHFYKLLLIPKRAKDNMKGEIYCEW